LILEQINKEKLLIVFSQEDIKKFNAIYGKSANERGNLLRVIREVLFLARVKTGFNSQNHKLMIELIEKNENCYVMATILNDEQKTSKIYKIKQNIRKCIFSFEMLEDLLCTIERVYKANPSIIDSQVVCRKKRYFMILQIVDLELAKLMPILSEYSKLIGEGSVDIARYFESCKIISDSKAIQTIGKQLTSK
jgi:hypothetical protein